MRFPQGHSPVYHTSKFNKLRCIEKFKQTNWTDISEQVNVNIANSLLENKIKEIIDSEAPMVTLQMRTKYNKFLTNETKLLMEERDRHRETARRTQDTNDWNIFKTTRNKFTR